MIYVGTSGWAYKDWAKAFYPKGWPLKRQFEFYAQHFPTVEINASFYRMPTEQAVTRWIAQAPKGFIYAVKGSRYVTHYHKLKPGARSFPLFFQRLANFQGHHLGAILWQLPGNLRKNLDRLEGFLSALPSGYRYAIEFRHPSWLEEDVFTLLRQRKVAHVLVSSAVMPMNFTSTADFNYIRFHGLEGGAAHDYTKAELQPWAELLQQEAKQGKVAYVYFNNDLNSRAPGNASMLMEMIGTGVVKI